MDERLFGFAGRMTELTGEGVLRKVVAAFRSETPDFIFVDTCVKIPGWGWEQFYVPIVTDKVSDCAKNGSAWEIRYGDPLVETIPWCVEQFLKICDENSEKIGKALAEAAKNLAKLGHLELPQGYTNSFWDTPIRFVYDYHIITDSYIGRFDIIGYNRK